MTFAIGENVGPYRVIEQLGQGGMATVYKAYHAALDRYVAIKVLHPAFLQDASFQKRFQREARAVARLEHPNIVPVYDFAEHAGQPYLVMKFIEGDTLKARLRQGPVSKGEGLRIVESAGAALSYAHQRGILHRDIKPSNILITPDGNVFLADFGLARMAEAGESTLSGDMMMGTPQYISPEQARGEKNLDPGTDIYSFGVVLYEMVVGRVPFNADTPFSIIHDHIYKPLPIPSRLNPRVPPGVERVLLKSLAKERADRYATIDEMVAAFREAVNEEAAPSGARPAAAAAASRPPAPPPPSPAVEAPQAAPSGAKPPAPKRRRWLWALGGLVGLCMCGFVFLALASSGEDAAAAEQATAQAALATEAAALPPETIPTRAPATPLPTDPPAVLDARQRVAENPDDPNAHLALAEALRSHGLDRMAAEAYARAAELFLEHEAELDAAMAALQALFVSGGPSSAGPRIENLAVEALFLAADNPGIVPLLAEAEEPLKGWERLPTIAARAALYLGHDEEFERYLVVALDKMPGDPIARSVRAEALYLHGEPVQAEAFARQILGQPRLPPWLVDHLNRMIEKPPTR